MAASIIKGGLALESGFRKDNWFWVC